MSCFEIEPSLITSNLSPTKLMMVDSPKLVIFPPFTKISISGSFVLHSFESRIDFSPEIFALVPTINLHFS